MNLSFTKDVALFSWAQAVAGISYFCYMLISARLLGVVDYGLFQAVMGIYGILVVFASPLNIATIHGVATSDDQIRPHAVGAFLFIAVIVGGACALILILLSSFFSGILHTHSSSPLLCIAFLVLVSPILTTFYGGLQGRGLYASFSRLKILESLLVLGSGIGLIVLKLGVSGAICGYVVAMGVLCLYFMSRRDLYHLRKGTYSLRGELRPLAKPLAVFGTLLFLLNYPVIVSRIRLTEEIAGLYGTLYSLRNLLLPFAFAAAVPLYTHRISKTSEPKILLKALLFVMIMGSIFLLIGIAFPKWFIVTLYGSEFAAVSPYLPYYAIALILQMITMVVMFYLAAAKKFVYSVLLIPIGIITSLTFIPQLTIGKIIVTQMISCSVYLGILCVMGFSFSTKRWWSSSRRTFSEGDMVKEIEKNG